MDRIVTLILVTLFSVSVLLFFSKAEKTGFKITDAEPGISEDAKTPQSAHLELPGI